MIDAHNHLHDPRFGNRQSDLIREMKDVGITACVVNGTSEADWPAVHQLAKEHPDFVIPSYGLHPWKVAERSADWIDHLRALLEEDPRVALGECGLDRWMTDPNLEEQHLVFRQQLALAAELARPITIHCLRASGPLLEELKAAPILPRFLVHSFAGSLETAKELVKLGAYFSFSGHFLHPRKEKVRAVFQNLPADRILVETDAPDMPPPGEGKINHPKNLRVISSQLASLTGISEALFQKNTEHFLS